MTEYKFDNKKHYIWYKRPHTGLGNNAKCKRIQCGLGDFMKWECVRWFIEEDMGLHKNEKAHTSIVIGKYIDEKDCDWFADNEIIKKQRILHVKVVPYWYFFDYNGSNYRAAPQKGPVYHPPAIRSFYKLHGIDLPALIS